MLAAWVCACGGSGPLVVPELRFGADEHFPDGVVLPPVGAGRIVVTNSLDDSVSLFPLETIGTGSFAELARAPVGLNPVELEGVHHAAIAPDGAHYFVALSLAAGGGSGPHGAHGTGAEDGYVLKYRVADHRLVASARVEKNPGDLAVSPDGRRLYVTHFDLNRITDVARTGGTLSEMDSNLVILDAESMTIVERVRLCPAAHGVRLLSSGLVFASCLSDEVAVVDPSVSPAQVQRVQLPNPGPSPAAPVHEPYAVTESPDGTQIWVSTLKSRAVFLLDVASRSFMASRTVNLDGPALFGTFNGAGDRLFIPFQRVDQVVEIDPATSAVRRTLDLPGCLNVHQVALTPDEASLLVVCEGDHFGPGQLLVLDVESGLRRNLVEVGVFPDYVGVIEGQP